MSKDHGALLSKDPRKLTRDEYLYLAQRDMLPADLKPKTEEELRQLMFDLNPNRTDLTGAVNTGTVNTLGISQEEFDAFIEWRRQLEAANPPDFTLEGPSRVMSDYSEMTKDQLHEEIVRRNANRAEEDKLDISGKKAELIARLEADDGGDEDSEDGEEEEPDEEPDEEVEEV